MTRRKNRAAISVAATVLVAAVVAAGVAAIINADTAAEVAIVAVSPIAFFAGLALATLFHELGHILPLIKRAKITEFCVLFLRLRLTSEGYKAGFEKNPYAGYASFVALRPDESASLLRKSLFGAFIMTIIAAVALAVAGAILAAFRLVAFVPVGAAAAGAVILFLLNYCVFTPETDGGLMENVSGSLTRAAAEIEIESRLFANERLSEMPKELFFGDGYYDVLRALEEGKTEEAKSRLDAALKNELNADNRAIPLRIQEFYFAVIERDDNKIAEMKDEIVPALDSFGGATALRVLAAYRGYTGELQWREVLLRRFLTECDGFFDGLYATEKQIIANESAVEAK